MVISAPECVMADFIVLYIHKFPKEICIAYTDFSHEKARAIQFFLLLSPLGRPLTIRIVSALFIMADLRFDSGSF